MGRRMWAGCLVISSGPWALESPILGEGRDQGPWENPGVGQGGPAGGRVASAPVSVPGPATESPAFWRSPGAPSPPWNSQQVTASLGSDRWGIDKGRPHALPGGGMGPRLSLWGCLHLHLGEFPSCLKVSPAQLFFLQKHSEPRRLLRQQPPLHRPRHLLLPFPR